ncbi:alpha/beta hydrolase [Nocardia sp. BMG51109]|uniref:alpha/beta hydrolase n=1 Tax=Nocardia sp. BMG51109 TaxID=1056816 RepID=UPI00350F824F
MKAGVLNARRARTVTGFALSGLLAWSVLGASPGYAAPAPVAGAETGATAPDGSHLAGVERIDDRNIRLQIYSAAMDQKFPVEIQLPTDRSRPRPSLYLLSGAGGGLDEASWQAKGHAQEFMSDKNANLILPIGGKFSYYTDWIKDDPALGRNKWKTYLTEELPPIIDRALGTNGLNAIAGISTSATTVLSLPIAKPGLFKSAAAYSGCVQASDPVGSRFVKTAVAWGGGNADNMWGPVGSPEWEKNDPYIQAEHLRGLNIYMSSGNGMPGRHDALGDPYALPGVGGLVNQVTVGGLIEAATNYCTQNMKSRLESLGIPATYHLGPGTHSWGYWQDEFERSWPVLARGMGL